MPLFFVNFQRQLTIVSVCRLRYWAALCLAIALWSVTPSPAHAATISVSNVNNSGEGSLRAAIISAASGDIIVFDSQLTGDTIVLNSVIGMEVALTIDGSTAPSLTISGGNVTTIFDTSFGAPVAINDLTLADGAGTTAGAIFASDALTLTNVNFVNNTAINEGGALVAAGTLTINGGVFENNRTTANYGGAIRVIAGTGAVTINGTHFRNNHAQINGGALATRRPVRLQATQWVNNRAGTDGGALWSDGATIIITDSLFLGNRAGANGGGLFVSDVINIARTSFIDNQSSARGGAIYQMGGNGNIVNSLFARNRAQQVGSALYLTLISNPLILQHNTIVDNVFSPGTAIYAANFIDGGSVQLTHSILTNHALGIVADNAPVHLAWNLFFANQTDYSGAPLVADPLLPNHDPRFVAPLLDDYRLQASSFAVDRVPTGPLDHDHDGNPRPQGNLPDIGAFESAYSSPPPAIRFDQPLYTVSESSLPTILLSIESLVASPLASVNFELRSLNGQVGADLLDSSQLITFAQAASQSQFNLSIVNDGLDEENEAIILQLNTPTNLTLGTPATATLVIVDNDAPPALAISDISADEAATVVHVPLSLAAPSGKTVTAQYLFYAGTASAEADFVISSGTVTIPAGLISSTVAISLRNDTLLEADETFFLQLGNAVNTILLNTTATITIVDDDPAPMLTVGNVIGSEDSAFLAFPLTLSSPAGVSVSIDYSSTSLSAVASVDFTPRSGSILLPAGQISTTIIVPLLNDTHLEAAETLRLLLSNPINATLLTPQALGTILDDDPPPLITANSPVALENAGQITFALRLSLPSELTATLTYTTISADNLLSPATPNSDFVPLSGTLTFAPGVSEMRLAIYLQDDQQIESDEILWLQLGDPLNLSIATSPITATIVDEDGVGDHDGDGLLDSQEDHNSNGNLADDDSDNDGQANYSDPDDDGDSLPTASEGSADPDGDLLPAYLDADDDNDTLLTQNEDVNHNGTPSDDNSDNDALPNYLDADDDNDTVSTALEAALNSDNDALPDPLDPDDDNDGIPSKNEDTNGDGTAANDDRNADNLPNYRDPNDHGQPICPGNLSWTKACDLTSVTRTSLNALPSFGPFLEDFGLRTIHSAQVATITHYLNQPDQSRWFRFRIEPGSRVVVQLTGLGANYDLTLYKDIAATWRSLQATDSSADLLRLGAEFAPDAFSPDAFSPDAFSPDAFSPDAFSPDAFSPDAFSPDAFSPDAFSPDAFSPDAFSPDAFSPDAFSPDAFSPDAFSPDAFSPDAFSAEGIAPDAFSPDAFSSAQLRSIVAVSAFEGNASEGIAVHTWENVGEFYVRVRGRNGVFDPQAPFTITVRLDQGGCGSVTSTLPASTFAVSTGNYKSIILVDYRRMAGDLVPLQAQLAALAARPEVAGLIVDVGQDERVAAANAQADRHPDCPYAKNLVASSIKEIISQVRALNPLQYVVLVGSDHAIPFFRHPDQSGIANERNYVPPVRDNTTSQASLRLGYLLSQDRYGSSLDLSFKDDLFPMPDLAVGRLVETPAEIMAVIDAYLSTVDGVVTPQSSLVTGYDFLADTANQVAAEFAAGVGVTPTTLIAGRELPPHDPTIWHADQLRNKLLHGGADMIFLAGHFSAFSALAADYQSRLSASEVASATVDLRNSLILGMGCHAGYNSVNEHGVPGITPSIDWAQAFARQQATLIAGTGYQYGDSDFLEYSERIYLEVAKALRYGEEPVAVGEALVSAKQRYLSQIGQIRPIHEKSLLIATLFGLPMLRIQLPAGRLPAPDNSSIIDQVTLFQSNPGQELGMSFADITLDPQLSPQIVKLTEISGVTTIDALYLRGSDGVVSNPTEPVLPLEQQNVQAPGNGQARRPGEADHSPILRGVGFRSATYQDHANVYLLTGAPATELGGVHPTFTSDVFYPIQPWRINYFAGLANAENTTQLAVTPAQYKSSEPGSTTGTLRQLSDMRFRLYYSDNTDNYANNNKPALTSPPAIGRVLAVTQESAIHFSVRVMGDPAAGVQEVWVTYTGVDASSSLYGRWQSLDLSQNEGNSTLWEGRLSISADEGEKVRFVVQAVNGVGLVNFSTNQGAWFQPNLDPGAPAESLREGGEDALATSITLLAAPTVGEYNQSISVLAQLSASQQAIGNTALWLTLGAQQRQALTDQSGVATFTLPLAVLPGLYQLQVSFHGTPAYQPATSQAQFEVRKQTPQLSLAEVQCAPPSTHCRASVLLRDVNQRPLRAKTILLLLTPASADKDGTRTQHSLTGITDYNGRVVFDLQEISSELADGTYRLQIYFGGVVTLHGGETITLEDMAYQAVEVSKEIVLTPSVLAEGDELRLQRVYLPVVAR